MDRMLEVSENFLRSAVFRPVLLKIDRPALSNPVILEAGIGID